jgi:hypothetical protein
MEQFYYDDFNVMQSDVNGHWVRVEELNKMIEAGVITVNAEKIKQYHDATRINK